MNTKYINLEAPYDDGIFPKLGQELKNGKIVVFKTDTVYGMGTNAYLENACKRIYEIKGRPMYKPLIVLISDISMLKELVTCITPAEQKLIDAFWPGPLTIKFKKKENILPKIVSAGDEYVRIRLVESELAHRLIKEAGVPIVAPSANLSGSPTGTNIKSIINELDGKVDYILDSGNMSTDTTSTIVEVDNQKVIVLREGKITKEDLTKIVSLKN